jgi:hypothetical protein
MSACAPADLLRFGTVAVSHPASCAFLSWRYEETTWQQAEVREVWDGLLALAKARAARECRRVGAMSQMEGVPLGSRQVQAEK